LPLRSGQSAASPNRSIRKSNSADCSPLAETHFPDSFDNQSLQSMLSTGSSRGAIAANGSAAIASDWPCEGVSTDRTSEGEFRIEKNIAPAPRAAPKTAGKMVRRFIFLAERLRKAAPHHRGGGVSASLPCSAS